MASCVIIAFLLSIIAVLTFSECALSLWYWWSDGIIFGSFCSQFCRGGSSSFGTIPTDEREALRQQKDSCIEFQREIDSEKRHDFAERFNNCIYDDYCWMFF